MSLFLFAGLFALTGSVARAQNQITIALTSNAMPSVVYHRPGGTSCVIESADSLSPPNWVTLNAGPLDLSNNLAFEDPQSLASSRFYRATDLAGVWTIPATVYVLSNQPRTILLGGVDTVINGPLTFTVTRLPSRGTLFQSVSLQPITNAPTVLQSSNAVVFLAATNDIGLPYTAFEYTVTSAARGVTSHPGRVTIEVAAADSAPIPTVMPLSTGENTPLYIQLSYNPGTPPSPVSVILFQTVNVGDLYQVGPDNVTIGARITGEAAVTNPNGLVCYVPPNDQYAAPLAAFSYFLVDAYGRLSLTDIVPINVNHINQPPVAVPAVQTGFTSGFAIGAILDYEDPDGPDGLTVCVMHIDDSIQLYSRSPFVLENQITAGMCMSNLLGFVVVPSYPFFYSGPSFPVITNYGSPYGTYSYAVSDGQYTTPVVTDTVDIHLGYLYPDPTGSPNTVNIPDKNPVTITLEGHDLNAGGDNTRLLFTIETLPQQGTLSIPAGNSLVKVPVVPFTLPLSNPSAGWPVVYTLASNYFNAQTNSDSFDFSLQDESGLAYPLPMAIQLPLPTHIAPSVTPPPANIVVTNSDPITVTLEGADPNPGDNTSNLVFTITNLTSIGKLFLPDGTAITNVPFTLPYSPNPTNGWPVVYLPNLNITAAPGVTNVVDSFKFTVVDQQGDPYPLPLNVNFNIPQKGGGLGPGL